MTRKKQPTSASMDNAVTFNNSHSLTYTLFSYARPLFHIHTHMFTQWHSNCSIFICYVLEWQWQSHPQLSTTPPSLCSAVMWLSSYRIDEKRENASMWGRKESSIGLPVKHKKMSGEWIEIPLYPWQTKEMTPTIYQRYLWQRLFIQFNNINRIIATSDLVSS